jgi:hypothetical protein
VIPCLASDWLSKRYPNWTAGQLPLPHRSRKETGDARGFRQAEGDMLVTAVMLAAKPTVSDQYAHAVIIQWNEACLGMPDREEHLVQFDIRAV